MVFCTKSLWRGEVIVLSNALLRLPFRKPLRSAQHARLGALRSDKPRAAGGAEQAKPGSAAEEAQRKQPSYSRS